MAEIGQFLQYLQEQFKELEVLLTKILKEERALHDDILIERGFIVNYYSLNYNTVNINVLSEILEYLEKFLKRKARLQDDLEKHYEKLNNIGRDYEAIVKKKLNTDLLAKYLKEALYYCELMIIRIKQLKAMLQDGMKLHKKSLPKETEIFFASFENIGTKIFRFVKFLEQIIQKIINFETEAYYPEPKTYGRAMAYLEYKKTLANKKLSSSKDPTPVFDASKFVIAKINTMSKDKIKIFFRQIGVVGVANIIFFETRLKPMNYNNPISQSNGLREYKFPKGIKVEILEAA